MESDNPSNILTVAVSISLSLNQEAEMVKGLSNVVTRVKAWLNKIFGLDGIAILVDC